MAKASTAKGNQYELEVKKCLLAAGFPEKNIFRQHRRPMFMNGRLITVGSDIFGCDFVVRCPERRRLLLWIQVGTVSNKSHKLEQVKDIDWQFEHERVQVWLREEGKKRFQVYQLQEVDGARSFVRSEDVLVPKDVPQPGQEKTNDQPQ